MEEEGTGSGGLRPSVEDTRLSTKTPEGGLLQSPRRRRPLGAREPVFMVRADPGTKRQRRMSAGSGEAGGKYQPRDQLPFKIMLSTHDGFKREKIAQQLYRAVFFKAFH